MCDIHSSSSIQRGTTNLRRGGSRGRAAAAARGGRGRRGGDAGGVQRAGAPQGRAAAARAAGGRSPRPRVGRRRRPVICQPDASLAAAYTRAQRGSDRLG
jgi:hypothetical protein